MFLAAARLARAAGLARRPVPSHSGSTDSIKMDTKSGTKKDKKDKKAPQDKKDKKGDATTVQMIDNKTKRDYYNNNNNNDPTEF